MGVEKLKRVFLCLFAAAFILSFDLRVLADEGHSHDQNIKKAAESFKNGTNNQKHDGMNHESGNGMEGMDHDSGSDMEGMDHGGGSDMEGMDHGSGSDMEGMDHGSGSDMEGMDHGSGSDMEGMDMEGESGGHDHHAPAVETPPNYKILGTYGAVNLLFILIGIWNKWFRRKGEVSNGNA
jgi:hypothetical protein